MTRRVVRVALSMVALILAGSAVAWAQDTSPLRLGVGYQLLHESVNGGGQTFPVGAYVDLEHAVTADAQKSLGWMGQFEIGYRTDSGFSEQLYTVLGGLRLASAKRLKWTPSGFGLVGMGTLNASCSQFCLGTDSGLALQGGFAMSTPLTDSTLIDITFKATKLWIEGAGVFNAAIGGGVRINLGK
jgi:hypothetical protein